MIVFVFVVGHLAWNSRQDMRRVRAGLDLSWNCLYEA